MIDDTKRVTLVGLGSVSEAVQKALESEKKSATKTKVRAAAPQRLPPRTAPRSRRSAGTCACASGRGADARPRALQDAAAVVGRMIAEKCKEKGIEQVVFDRGGFKYHGRIMVRACVALRRGSGVVAVHLYLRSFCSSLTHAAPRPGARGCRARGWAWVLELLCLCDEDFCFA